ncbi:MAG: cell division protein FtsA [Candidatus Latescibacterota bacterium]|nr:cell division protein FtsA [Candidatus Latescibacterota bacterium]
MNWNQEHSSTIAGLDLGTTKICAIIAERIADGRLRIIGTGQHPSDGLRRGVIVDAEKTVQAIGAAVRQAELMAGVEAGVVYAGIAGEHIASLNSTGMVAVSDVGGRITALDRERVLETAGAIKVPMDREVLHVLPQEFAVDGKRGIPDPVGMYGVRLEANVHVVTAAVTAVQNISRSILRAGVDVRDIVLEPLASSYAVLNADERQMGVCLIDIGGGTTDVAVFAKGGLRYSGIIGLGGQNVTNDVGIGLRTSRSEAERIKCAHGAAVRDWIDGGDQVEVPGIAGRSAQLVSRWDLADMVEARMEEIFSLARQQIFAALPNAVLGAGIVLTGGGSQVEGAVALAERVFGTFVRLGSPVGLEGMAEGVSSPPYATALGLVLYGAEQRGDKTGTEVREMVEDRFDSLLGRIKKWLQTRG